MGKNKQPKPTDSLKQGDKTGQHPSKKSKRDRKPKQEEHLQQIPFRLREIMKSKERMKKGSIKTKQIKDLTPKPKKGTPQVEDIPVPHFRRRKRESEPAYLRRMNSATSHVLFLTKNQLERKPEMKAEGQEKPADNRKSEKKKDYDKTRLQRLHKKKLDRREERAERDMLIDKVEFGDVAMAPPTLSVKPKKAPIKGQGMNSRLLLTSLMGHAPSSSAKPSMARQRIMEEERLRVVEAYRHLKKQKQLQQQNKAAGLDKLMSPQ